uniref:Uncharacterized protein n=1 Tax=Magallana gigas TaxID=29159 RepID=A0A8W8KC79_MAGGI
MYAPKRSAFSYESYKCRCYLAATDYTMHLERDPVRDKNGNKVNKRKFSKSSNNWTSAEVIVPKTYSYIPKLMMAIMNEYCSGYQLKPSKGTNSIVRKRP